MRFSCPIIIGILAISLPPTSSANVLPILGPGRFDVRLTSMPLTDPTRLDPFAKDGRRRSVMVSGFYPVAPCHSKLQEPYMPPATANFQGDKFAAYGLPDGSFQSLFLETCNGTSKPITCPSNSLPIVLFSGALGTSRLVYSSLLQSVAAAGYLVVSVDHPYDADFVEFPDGTNVTAVDISSDAEVEAAINTRVQDITFVHQQLSNTSITEKLFPGSLRGRRIPNTAIVGHSLGGATAAAAMLQLPYIKGGLNIDGTMFGPVLTSGLNRPFMLVGHENKTQETDPSWKAIWPNLKGWKKEFEVKGTAHYSFSDLPLVTSVLGLDKLLPPQIGEVLGTLEGQRVMNITVSYTTAFLDFVLKSGSEGILKGASKQFPEVVKVA